VKHMLLATVAAVAILSSAALGQTLPQGVQKGPSMGGITEYDFPNGLTVLLYPDPANPKVTVDVTYTVGSRHEGYGETGMAHLLEHMNFIETTNGRKIKDEIVSHGAQWNGATSYDRTNFFETVTASDENLKWALGLEADRMVNVKFTKQILDTEMTVVRNEFERGENAPTQVLNQRVMATAYLWHNYGKAVIGSKEDIEKVPVNRLAEFYRKFYQPDNAVVIVTGRFDDSKALQFVAETLGRIPRATRVLDETYTVEPAQDGERYIELRRVGQNPAVEMAYHGPSAGHPDSAAFQVLAGIMDGLEGRLTKAIVDSKLATSASMFAQRMHDPGVIEFVAVLTPDQSLDEVKKAMLKVIDGIVTEPPSKEEMDRVKTNLLRSLESSLANPQAIATGALTAAVSQGDWRLMFADHDRLQKVTAEDVARVAKAYLKPSNRTVGYYIPDAAPDRTVVPASPSLKVELKDYKSAFTIAHGEAFDPTPANVESRAVRAKLPNGMKTVILPKQTEAKQGGGDHLAPLRRRGYAQGQECGWKRGRSPVQLWYAHQEPPAAGRRNAQTGREHYGVWRVQRSQRQHYCARQQSDRSTEAGRRDAARARLP